MDATAKPNVQSRKGGSISSGRCDQQLRQFYSCSLSARMSFGTEVLGQTRTMFQKHLTDSIETVGKANIYYNQTSTSSLNQRHLITVSNHSFVTTSSYPISSSRGHRAGLCLRASAAASNARPLKRLGHPGANSHSVIGHQMTVTGLINERKPKKKTTSLFKQSRQSMRSP